MLPSIIQKRVSIVSHADQSGQFEMTTTQYRDVVQSLDLDIVAEPDMKTSIAATEQETEPPVTEEANDVGWHSNAQSYKQLEPTLNKKITRNNSQVSIKSTSSSVKSR
jgi:hypothetical protein